MIKTQLKIVHQAMHQSKFGEAQNATTDSLMTFLSVAGIIHGFKTHPGTEKPQKGNWS